MPKLPYSMPKNPAPRYSRADRTAVDLLVIFPHLAADPIQFTAAASDPGWEHGEEIFARAIAGDFGPVAEYTPPPAL